VRDSSGILLLGGMKSSVGSKR